MHTLMVMLTLRRAFTIFALLSLSACGGGGGGSASPPNVPGSAGASTVSGDMLGIVPSRGWNYQGSISGTPATVSLYADPQTVNGLTELLVAAVPGTIPTVLTDPTTVANNLQGRIDVTHTASGYQAVQISHGGDFFSVPGSPLLVPDSLTLNQSWSADGATAKVVAIGTVAGSGACPINSDGAQVQYTYNTTTAIVSYVPGCGITQVINGTSTLTLVSVGDYSSLGQLSAERKIPSRHI